MLIKRIVSIRFIFYSRKGAELRIEQFSWSQESGWNPGLTGELADIAQLVLLFGNRRLLEESDRLQEISGAYPKAQIFGCSSGGEILDTQVNDESLVLTAAYFKQSHVSSACVRISDTAGNYNIGEQLAKSLEHNGLRHAVVLSDGLSVNGSELVNGITENLPDGIPLTGGLAGDGMNHEDTLIVCDGQARRGAVGILGFYGDKLKTGCGSRGGWNPFGPERLVTKSEGNVLFELDGRPALELYKLYLGEHAAGLPTTAVIFPLCIRSANSSGCSLVRTVISVDESNGSVVFAGNMPEGRYAQLMKANVDNLIDGATAAAQTSCDTLGSLSPDLVMMISCVGRRRVMKQRVEEEVDAVRDVVGTGTPLAGYYSLGEIAPFSAGEISELHNQTMTITTFRESDE